MITRDEVTLFAYDISVPTVPRYSGRIERAVCKLSHTPFFTWMRPSNSPEALGLKFLAKCIVPEELEYL